MGLSRALFSGISGLKGQQVKLDIIGNNIANVSTQGFKKSRVIFSDLFSDTVTEGNSPTGRVGGKNPSQIGLGIQGPTIEQVFTEGPTTQTGVATDLAITGDGFFVAGDGNKNLFTRDGNFKVDATGDLVMSGSNLRIQGWMAKRDDTGTFVVDTSGTLESLNLQENRKQFAVATDEVTYSSNLDSGSSMRNIEQAETFINYRDNSSDNPEKQKLQTVTWSFTKVDANNYNWTATDTTGSVIANGALNINDFGEILDSTVFGAGDTQVNYDPTDTRFQDIFTTTASGQIDPDLFLTNQPDNLADVIMNPDAVDFLNLSKAARPRAVSFTYDPDGPYIAGKWSDPHGVPDLSQSTQNLNLGAAIDETTGQPVNLAGIPNNLAPANISFRNIMVNNSRANDKAGITLHNYEGLQTGGTAKSASGQIRVDIIGDSGGDPNKMNVRIYKNFLENLDAAGNPFPATLIGEFHGMDRLQTDHRLSIPGLMEFTMSDSNAATTGWVNTNAAAAATDGYFFNVQSPGSFNPIDDGRFFTGLSTVFHDGPKGPNKFELRNIDASLSEYTGDLRIVFNGPTSFQVIDDNNVVLNQGVLRDTESDTDVEVAGINFTFHREGITLLPKDQDSDGFLGAEIKLTGFVGAEGRGGPVTIDIPKISEINTKTGQILKAEKDIDYHLGFSKATAIARTGWNDGQPPGVTTVPGVDEDNGTFTSLNGTTPQGTVTVDASRAAASAIGNYRIEFGVRNDFSAVIGYDPYSPHNDPATVTGAGIAPFAEDLNNQVLKVYFNGESQPSYIVDLNPQDDATGDTAQQLGLDGLPLTNSDFTPTYNFYAQMQNFRAENDTVNTGFLGDTVAANAGVANSFQDQYNKVNRQINLPNGVIINLTNVNESNKIGTLASNAYTGTANFMFGDQYNFDVTETGVGGIDDIDTYSAAFKQGALHSTTIEVFDSLGGSHNLTATYEHVDKKKGEWNYYLSLGVDDPLIEDFLFNPPAGFQVVDPRKPTEEELRKANETIFTKGRQGKLFFKNDGNIDQFNSFIPDARFTPADADEVRINLDKKLVTQFEAEFSTAARDRTGNSMGLLEGFSIENDGSVVGSFDNGNRVAVAQLAVATFTNSDGLIKKGQNTFLNSTNSGRALIGTAGTDARGLINAGVLEGSNVDLTDEFTELIIAQRSFTANGRIITTSDEFIQEILSLKR